jgi:ParB family chromosome partitioning protein
MALQRAERPEVRTAGDSTPTRKAEAWVARAQVPVSAIVPDSSNRTVTEDDDFELLCDSIRVQGVLAPVHVWRQPDGNYQLIDGERRWRAATKIGLGEIPCDVWPAETDRRRMVVAGVVLNEHRKAHGSLHVALRLRDLKNESGLTHEGLAEQTGLPIDRVKTYFSLILASDHMQTFIDQHEIPLKVAAELVRYERATNPARARKLTERYKESPLTAQQIIALRKREQRGTERKTGDAQPARQTRLAGIMQRFEAEVRREPSALSELEKLVGRLGYRLVPLDQAQAA